MVNLTKLEIGAGLVLAAVLLYALSRSSASGVGSAIGAGAVNTAAGVVTGVGDAVGIPRTNSDRCAIAMAAGNNWDASLYCPAGTFIKYMLDGSKLPPFDPGSGGNTW
jgi:hypothetical protein